MVRANYRSSNLLESLDSALEKFDSNKPTIKAPFDKFYRVGTEEEIAELEGMNLDEFKAFETEDPVRDYIDVLGYAIAKDEYRDMISDASGLIYTEIGEDGKLYYNVGDRVFEVELSDIGLSYDEISEDEDIETPSEEIGTEIDKEETLDEMIKRAHDEELSAIGTYDGILAKIGEDDKLKEMIDEIKKDEQDHEKLLSHYIETGEPITDDDLEDNEDEDKLEESEGLNKAITHLEEIIEICDTEDSIDQDVMLYNIDKACDVLGNGYFDEVLDKLNHIKDVVREEQSIDQDTMYDTVYQCIKILKGESDDEIDVAGFDKGKELERLHESSKEDAINYLVSEFKYLTREQAEKEVDKLENLIKDQQRRTNAEQNKEELEKEYKKLHGDDWSHWEEFTASKINEDESNTSTIFIDLEDILGYAEKHISELLTSNGGSKAKIAVRDDGQYTLTLNREDGSIDAFINLDKEA